MINDVLQKKEINSNNKEIDLKNIISKKINEQEQLKAEQQYLKEHPNLIDNNNIIIDLLLKNNKVSAILSLILDFNNSVKVDKTIIEPQKFNNLSDNIFKCINELNNIYIDLLQEFNHQEVKK